MNSLFGARESVSSPSGRPLKTLIYSKKQFVEALKSQCEKNYDIVHLSRWAHGVFLDNCKDLEVGLQPFIMKVVAMEEGEEFELTKEQLLEDAEKLLVQR